MQQGPSARRSRCRQTKPSGGAGIIKDLRGQPWRARDSFGGGGGNRLLPSLWAPLPLPLPTDLQPVRIPDGVRPMPHPRWRTERQTHEETPVGRACSGSSGGPGVQGLPDVALDRASGTRCRSGCDHGQQELRTPPWGLGCSGGSSADGGGRQAFPQWLVLFLVPQPLLIPPPGAKTREPSGEHWDWG
ncbi:hypothetical protein NDU88_008320 [Pleurodeles waltl]|uniref:Uncharacterized protein n=1 Tax=Pleurodeles waltl TaxID=8319 RepID=A0AAV7QRE9_PLEWA|nr:hypothetical protein NDU88_008320 [Pleurodeles waltl]